MHEPHKYPHECIIFPYERERWGIHHRDTENTGENYLALTVYFRIFLCVLCASAMNSLPFFPTPLLSPRKRAKIYATASAKCIDFLTVVEAVTGGRTVRGRYARVETGKAAGMGTTGTIRVATRGSALALAQAGLVIAALQGDRFLPCVRNRHRAERGRPRQAFAARRDWRARGVHGGGAGRGARRTGGHCRA